MTAPPAMGAVVAWFRSAAAILGVAADRINTGTVPGDAPKLVITRVGGRTSDDVAWPVVQIEVTAATRTVAEAICTLVEQLLDQQGTDGALPVTVDVPTDTGTVTCVVLAASAESGLWAPDPESDSPRFVVTGRVAVRRAGG